MVKRGSVRPEVIDDLLGERVAVELQRRGWSYGELARRMDDHGCPISKAALHRVVNGNPGGGRRGLSARELVTLAAVLEVEVEDLLTPIELLDKKRAQELMRELDDAEGEFWLAAGRLHLALAELAALAVREPELSEYLSNRARTAAGNGAHVLLRPLQLAPSLPRAVFPLLSQSILAMQGINRRWVPAGGDSNSPSEEETS